MNIKVDGNIRSEIALKNMYIESISFNRTNDVKDLELTISFDHSTTQTTNNEYQVDLACTIKDVNGRFNLYVKTIGLFLCENVETTSYEQNLIAIIFPFLRSQVATATSQPNLEPIVIPPININALIAKQKKGGR